MRLMVDDYVRNGALNDDAKEILRLMIENKKNILVIGQSGSGKTTFVKALLNSFCKDCKIAVVTTLKIEYEDLIPEFEVFPTVDKLLPVEDKFDYVVVDTYEFNLASVKRISRPMIVMTNNKRIESRLHYLAKGLFFALIKMVYYRWRDDPYSVILDSPGHIIDSIKVFDPHLKLYTSVYVWSEGGGDADIDKFKRFLEWEPKEKIE